MKLHGEIVHATINYHRSWRDRKLAAYSGLYLNKLLDELTHPGYAVLVENAFPRYSATVGKKCTCAEEKGAQGHPRFARDRSGGQDFEASQSQ